jgi:uncharacterized low-complexity protein
MKSHASAATLLSGAFLGSFALIPTAKASPVFQATELVAGTLLAQALEGKCGEGRCAAAKLDTDRDGRVTYREAEAAGFSERQCRAWDKNGNATLEQNELAAMHAILDVPARTIRAPHQ